MRDLRRLALAAALISVPVFVGSAAHAAAPARLAAAADKNNLENNEIWRQIQDGKAKQRQPDAAKPATGNNTNNNNSNSHSRGNDRGNANNANGNGRSNNNNANNNSRGNDRGNTNNGNHSSNDNNGRGRNDWNSSNRHDNDRNTDRGSQGWNNNHSNYNDNHNRSDWNRNNSSWNNNHRYDWRGYRQGHRPSDWERFNRTLNRALWQRNFNAQQRYHWYRYERPRGWYYRHWTYGERLPFAFWSSNYWINSYYDYGLQDPPYGYVWVRYGDDALLVDVEDGTILRVVYGLYY